MGNRLMVFRAVIMFNVVATLGGTATTTLGDVAVSALRAVGTGGGALGWPDMIKESCQMSDRCFNFALAIVGIVPPSCSKMSLATRRVLSCLDKMETWQWVGYISAKCRRNGSDGLKGCKNADISSD
jgi:hypothetical protein